ncbi:hypothetical protein BCR39DRAFT_522894 [Naematelia encephala]|uniref:Uncharacterized protein n=1 Tax=Naematelia encephala TaxID=71784 RepID=A0A1Y2BCX8_9TREE|nr:hypothetical protein BCR39DRAFT_522894 [Naematelia encephala]
MGLFNHQPSDSKVPHLPSSSPSASKADQATMYPHEKPRDPPSYQPPPITSSFAGPSRPVAPTYAALHLAKTDRVRLIGFPPDAQRPVNDAILRAWPVGIQQQGPFDASSYEWKLSGRPWSGQGSEAVPARRLMSHLLHALSASGWHLAMSVDLSRKGWDKDTLLFRSGPGLQRYFFSVSFNEGDKVRIIDPPNEVTKQAFIDAISTWPLGIQASKEKEPACHQLKLRGNPWWTSDGHQINQSRLLACAILSAMDACGFELVGSVDMSVGTGDNNLDLDSWFFASKI